MDKQYDKLLSESNKSELKQIYEYNHQVIISLYENLNLSIIKDTCKMSNVQNSTIAIFGAISALFNGPKNSWQEIKEYINKNDIISKLPEYYSLSKFYSFNRILDDYNKVKTFNIIQTSVDYNNLIQIYLLIVENLELLIKLGN
jgi:hypothetical protein